MFVSKYNDSLLFIYLYQMNLTIAMNIKWLIITHDFIKNKERFTKKNNFKLYCFIRYLLLAILFIYLTIMVIVFLNLMNYLIHLVWSTIWGKIKKGFLMRSSGTPAQDMKHNKTPKNPKNSNTPFSTPQTKDHKDIKKKLQRWNKNY